jgi:histidinol-phosphate aminotransferase
MYEVSANINNVEVKTVLLTEDFQLDIDAALKAIDKNTKLIFVCSPNNPSGNMMSEKDIEALLKHFAGLVVLDEAYIDFAESRSWLKVLSQHPNLVILQTFSKAWGMAALRIGMAFASTEIIDVLNKIKAPYNINHATQEMALQALEKEAVVKQNIKTILKEKNALVRALSKYPFIKKIFPSESNFVLLQVNDADRLYDYLVSHGIVVRNRSRVPLCENCLRITIGTANENLLLQDAFNTYQA